MKTLLYSPKTRPTPAPVPPPAPSPPDTSPLSHRGTLENDLLLSFVIPTPTKNPANLCRTIFEQVEPLGAHFELLFVGCAKTGLKTEALRRSQSTPGQIRFVPSQAPSDRSASLNSGYQEARGALIFSLEPDLSDDPRKIREFLLKINWPSDRPHGRLDQRKRHCSLSRWQRTLPRGILHS